MAGPPPPPPPELRPPNPTAAQGRLDKLRAAAKARNALKGERLGQAYFNALYFDGHDPEFADSIRGGPIDPFYLDGLVPAMLVALRERCRVSSAASIDYACATCGKPVTVPHAAAWPSRCPHCGTAPPTLMVKVGGATVAAGRTGL